MSRNALSLEAFEQKQQIQRPALPRLVFLMTRVTFLTDLQQQFETLSPKVRYKQYLDPSVEETKKFCVNLRKQAKDERVLMYYNGHGVPKPTASGEIWVFNKSEYW